MQGLVFEKQTSLQDITDLRNDYLKSINEPQELYLELFVRKGNIYLIKMKNDVIGYFIFGDEGNLLEYHILKLWFNLNDDILKTVIQQYEIKTILCKSFDIKILSCCLELQNKTEVVGYLFRDYEKKEIKLNTSDIKVRLASSDDYEFIKEINEEVFENENEIRETINNNNMFIFSKKSEVIGFGIFQRTIPGYNSFDIGMLVVKKYRQKGYGSFLIQYLTEYCKQNGWRATCGCAINNIASRKTLEKAGYLTRYRMILFHV